MPQGSWEILQIVEDKGSSRGKPVITDYVHRDDACAAGLGKRFTQPLVSPLGLLVMIGADKPIEDLAQRER